MDKMKLHEKMLENIAFTSIPYYRCVKTYSAPEYTVMAKNKVWTIWVHNSMYQTGIILSAFRERNYNLFFEPYEKQLFVGSGDIWTEQEVKEFFTDDFCNTLLASLNADRNLGDVTKKGKSGITLWNFHSHRIYYKG